MKFTKLTLIAMLLALLVCAFVACGPTPVETDAGSDTAGDSQTEAAPETDPTPVTDANGEHVHTPVEQIDEPTCEQRGYKREICSTCNEQLSVKPIDMVDHTAEAPATCTAGSLCKFCGTVMESAKGHNVTTITETKAPTNTEAGYEKGTCADCGEEVTTVLPAGITDNYNNFPAGALTVDTMSANSAFGSDFTYKVSADAFEVVTEGNNSYIKKPGANGQIYYTGAALNAKKLEMTFDFRLDQECKDIRGLISIVNGKEMRILNVYKNGVYFGINGGGVIEVVTPEVGTWVKLKIVLNTETYDYEIYADGELMLATASDPDNAGMHLIYTRVDGELTQKSEGFNNATIHGERSPFVPMGEGISDFYFYHWSADLACSLDNLTVSMIND